MFGPLCSELTEARGEELNLREPTSNCRPAGHEDLSSVARIHKAQFQDHFLGQYSTSLLGEFYRTFLGMSVFLVHDGPNGVDGFVLGGLVTRISMCRTEFVRRNLLRCLWETLIRPRIWGSGIQRACALLVHRKTDAASNSPIVSLLSIAVSREAVGRGFAASLVTAFEHSLQGTTNEYRLSVAADNTRAICFYKKMGMQLIEASKDSVVFHREIAPKFNTPARNVESEAARLAHAESQMILPEQ